MFYKHHSSLNRFEVLYYEPGCVKMSSWFVIRHDTYQHVQLQKLELI